MAPVEIYIDNKSICLLGPGPQSKKLKEQNALVTWSGDGTYIVQINELGEKGNYTKAELEKKGQEIGMEVNQDLHPAVLLFRLEQSNPAVNIRVKRV